LSFKNSSVFFLLHATKTTCLMWSLHAGRYGGEYISLLSRENFKLMFACDIAFQKWLS